MILRLNLYNTHASFLLTPLSTTRAAVTLLTNSILPLRNHIHRDTISTTKRQEQQSLLPLRGCLSQKRIEISTRTVVSQAHTYQWLGSFGNRGNGEYRKELAPALEIIRRYLEALGLPQTHALLRLDGLYGTGAVMADLDGFFFVIRGKDYAVLDHP